MEYISPFLDCAREGFFYSAFSLRQIRDHAPPVRVSVDSSSAGVYRRWIPRSRSIYLSHFVGTTARTISTNQSSHDAAMRCLTSADISPTLSCTMESEGSASPTVYPEVLLGDISISQRGQNIVGHESTQSYLPRCKDSCCSCCNCLGIISVCWS